MRKRPDPRCPIAYRKCVLRSTTKVTFCIAVCHAQHFKPGSYPQNDVASVNVYSGSCQWLIADGRGPASRRREGAAPERWQRARTQDSRGLDKSGLAGAGRSAKTAPEEVVTSLNPVQTRKTRKRRPQGRLSGSGAWIRTGDLSEALEDLPATISQGQSDPRSSPCSRPL
jgi:hypothetical protein